MTPSLSRSISITTPVFLAVSRLVRSSAASRCFPGTSQSGLIILVRQQEGWWRHTQSGRHTAQWCGLHLRHPARRGCTGRGQTIRQGGCHGLISGNLFWRNSSGQKPPGTELFTRCSDGPGSRVQGAPCPGVFPAIEKGIRLLPGHIVCGLPFC